VGVRLVRTPGPPAAPEGRDAPPRWRAALVNNMPDAAFDATERQFLGLLEAGSGCETIDVTRHTMDGVPRSERVQERIAADYRPLEDIAADPPDLVVVTGSNPLEPRIEDEPYWSDLCDLLQWGSEHVPALLLSCLSAHAALLTYDGIDRTTLPEKCTGVFAQQADPDHPLTAGLGSPIVLPHSRLNAVAPKTVRAAGYRTALASEEVGWSVITKTVGRAQVVLVQGHPEYDPSSLIREYHRDVRRYAGHERDEPPCLPRACVSEPDWSRLRQLHRRVVGGERDPALVASFPFEEVGDRAPWPWRGVAVSLYTNLMATIPQRSA
jgi:homoserine O-succinyltransferase/O-acetyltransferase